VTLTPLDDSVGEKLCGRDTLWEGAVGVTPLLVPQPRRMCCCLVTQSQWCDW
jgi:hypothetical protein